MKKIMSVLLAVVLIFGIMAPTVPAAAEEGGGQTPKARRTILLYDCGTDLESNEGMATYNLRQILRSKFSANEDIRFVVMTGGSNDWKLEKENLIFPDGVNVPEDAVYLLDEEEYADDQTSKISNVYNQIWEAKGLDAKDPDERGKMILLDGDGILGDGATAKRSMIKPEDYVDEDGWEVFDTAKIGDYEWMNDPEVLKAFINFGVENYPAEKYDLILWDHGSGPGGFCNNEQEYMEATDTMSVPEIMDALLHNKVVDPDGDGVQDNKFDILDFDACLMGSTEVLLALADFADYYIASPEPEPGYGQDYEGWLNMLGEDSVKDADTDSYELSKKIVDDFIAFYDKDSGDGWDEEGTLAVFNTEKLMNTKVNNKTLVEALISFNRTLNDEILGTDYHDEFRAFRDCLTYGLYANYDLGVLASQLAYLYSDAKLASDGSVNNTSSYTESAAIIQNLLNDKNVVYARGTKAFFTEPHYYRDSDGTMKYGRQGTSGLYLTFDTVDNPVEPFMDYYPDMRATIAKLEDMNGGEDSRVQFFKEYLETSWKYGFVHFTGSAVTRMVAEGTDKNDITYEAVKKYWQTVPSGLNDEYPWDFICKDYVELIGGEEAAKKVIEGWISQMVNEAVLKSDIEVQPLKKKNTDAGVITFNNIKKQAIDSVEANLIAELPAVNEFINDPAYAEYTAAIRNMTGSIKIGKISGSEIVDIDPETEGYEAAIKWLSEPTSKWEVDLPELKWYALKDADGKLHVTAAEFFGSHLEIPTGFMTKELREEYDEDTDSTITRLKDVFHTYTLFFRQNSEGKWYFSSIMMQNESGSSRYITAKEFTGKVELRTSTYISQNHETVDVPISRSSFILSPETIDKISLEYVDISEIPNDIADTDGDGRAVHSTVTATNIYGYSLDITDQIQKATGSEVTHIEMAEVKPGVYSTDITGELVPVVVCEGKTLESGVDYILKKVNASDTFDKVGTFEVQLIGKGRFTGKTVKTFKITKTGWRKDSKGWWYDLGGGQYLKNCWKKIDGKWYFFDKEGYMETNAYRQGYYLKANGAWDGEAQVTGWKQDSKGWRYSLGGREFLKNGWKKINGNWYYFKATGYIAINEFVQGWWLNKTGAWKDPVQYSWHKAGSKWWYGTKDGWYAKGKSYTIDGKTYAFDKNGYTK